MGVYYILVNQTRREQIDFIHIPVGTKREIAGNPVSAAMVAWYLLEHLGDEIAFITDCDGDWPFKTGKRADLILYPDRTEELVLSLVHQGILADCGAEYFDELDPSIYMRRLENIWFESSVFDGQTNEGSLI